MDNPGQQPPFGGRNPNYPPLPANENQYSFSHNLYNQSPPISTTAMPQGRQPQVTQSPGHHAFNMGPVPQYLPPANKNPPPNHQVPLQGGPGVSAHQAMGPNWNVAASPQTSHPVTNSNYSTQYVPTNTAPVGRRTPGQVSNTNYSTQYMPTTASPAAHPVMYPVSPGPQYMPRPTQSTVQTTPPPGRVPPPGVQRPTQLSASNGQGISQNYGQIINSHLVPPTLRANGYAAAGPSPQVPGHPFTGGHSSPQPIAAGNGNRPPRPASARPLHFATRFNLPSNAQIAPQGVQARITTPSAALNSNVRQGSSIPTSMSSTSVPPIDTPPNSMSSTTTPPASAAPASAAPAGTPSTSAPPTVMPLDRMEGSDSLNTIDDALGKVPLPSAPPTGATPQPSVQTPSVANKATMGKTAKRGADQDLPQQPAKKPRKKAARVSATQQPPVDSVQQPASSAASGAQHPPPATNNADPVFYDRLPPRDPTIPDPDEPMHLPDYELDKIKTPYVVEPEVEKPRPEGKTALAWEEAVEQIDQIVKDHVRPGRLLAWTHWYRIKDLSNAMEEFIARPGRRRLAPQEPVDLLNVRYIRVIEDGIHLGDFSGGIPNRSHEVYKNMFLWAKEREVNAKWARNAWKRRETGPSPAEVEKQIYKWDKLTGSSKTPASREEPEAEEESEEARRVRTLATHKPKPWWLSGLPPK